jgi:hypothetical protein
LREAHIERAEVEALLARMRAEHVFESDAFRHSWFGPDSDYIVIQLVSGGECVRLKSWHEGYEDNPNLAVVNGVGVVLQEEPREAVMARATPEWLRFLGVWRDVRSTVASWIPANGVPCRDALDLKGLW